jgi:spermidine/putrescine transport system substrate-binding protein
MAEGKQKKVNQRITLDVYLTSPGGNVRKTYAGELRRLQKLGFREVDRRIATREDHVKVTLEREVERYPGVVLLSSNKKANIDPAFEDPAFDPGRAYSMPYFWGTVGIGYRMSRVSPESWADMFASDKHAGRISLLDSTGSIQSALKYLGHSLNTDDPAQIDEAARVLIEAKPRITEFAPDTGQDLLLIGEVDLCLEYNGDILQVMEEDDDLAYAVPEEGALLWEDTMCIPTGAPNPTGAHRFINFILDGEVHGDIATFIRYPCPNAAAMEYIPEADRTNPSIYPPREILQRCELPVYKGEEVEQMYADAMARVLAA